MRKPTSSERPSVPKFAPATDAYSELDRFKKSGAVTLAPHVKFTYLFGAHARANKQTKCTQPPTNRSKKREKKTRIKKKHK